MVSLDLSLAFSSHLLVATLRDRLSLHSISFYRSHSSQSRVAKQEEKEDGRKRRKAAAAVAALRMVDSWSTKSSLLLKVLGWRLVLGRFCVEEIQRA